MAVEPIAAFDLGDAGFQVAPPLKADEGTIGLGSRNLIGFGRKNRRAWKGLDPVAGKTGSRILFNAGGKLGGLVDVSATEAKGSVDLYLRNTIWFMGYGQLMYDGANITGAVASTTQKVLVRYNDSYTHANSGPYDAGLPQPSPPDVAARDEIGSGFTGKCSGLRSYMIASVRDWTGDRSRASYVSLTVEGDNKTDRLTFPTAPVGGTGWVVFAPKLGFGGTGVHRRLRAPNRVANREFLESDIERTFSDIVTHGTTSIDSLTAAFTSADIGKLATLDNGVDAVFESPIQNVTGPTTAILEDAVPFTSVAVDGTFTAYVDGILRTVEVEYDDTDLTSEAAWITDYPPMAAVYSFPLVDVRIICGCLTDAIKEPTVDDSGTCLSVSNRNYPGSYDPLNLLYMPEKFVGAVGRATDRHFYVYGKGWTGATQYTGADFGPAATISTVWGDTGFRKAHNVCLAYGRLYGFSSKGAAVRLQNGEEPDTKFADDVQPIFDTWDPDKVVVTTYKHAVKYAHESQAFLFYLQDEKWLPACYLSDYADGDIVSAISLDAKTYVTMKENTTFSLFEFDAGAGSACTAMTNYVGGPAIARAKTINEVAETVILDDDTLDYYISLHRNGQRLSIDDVTMAAGSNLMYSTAAKFTDEDLGKYVLLFDAISRRAATGPWTFAVNPTNGETINVNGVVFTFRTVTVVDTDIQIAGTKELTSANFRVVLNASLNVLISVATYTVVSNVVTGTYDTYGSPGNAFTMAASSGAHVTVAHATFTGGGTDFPRLPLLGRISQIVSAGSVRVVTPVRPLGAVAISPNIAVTDGNAIIGNLIFTRSGSRTGSLHQLGKRLNFRNCFSYAIGISIVSNGDAGSPVHAALLGSVKPGRGGNPAF